MTGTSRQLKKMFVRSKTDDVTGHETDEEQPHTANMLDLESEEYAEQRRMQEGERLKILTPDQMLTSYQLPISLAQ